MLQRVRALLSRRRFEENMSEELRFHLQQYTEDLVRSGMPLAKAERQARLELGLNTVKEECREARGLYWIDELVRQVRHALRLLRKSPGFTATALATLAICLGANLAIFAVIDSVLLRSLPFPAAERLVTIYNTYPKAGVDRDGSSVTNYYERRGQLPAFSSLSIYREREVIVGEPGSTEKVPILAVSPEFFETVGVLPVRGRAFKEEETTFESDQVAILTHACWQRRFNADPEILGRQFRVNARTITVVGVLPAEFRFLSSDAQFFAPFASNPEERTARQRHSGGNRKCIVARLKPGATLSEAQAQIDSHNAALEAGSPQAKMLIAAGFRSVAVGLHEDHVAAIRPVLWLLQAGVAVLLLIGIVNLANLLLIRANGRMKEIAVRQALGADARQIVTEVLVETTLLTLLGGVLGCAVGAGGVQLLASLGASQLPLGAQVVFDARTAWVALLAALAIGVILAWPIAWFSLRDNVLRGESRGATTSAAAQRLRHASIVAEIALAFVLLASGGLLGLSLNRAMAVSPGFRPNHVLTGQILLPWTSYAEPAIRYSFVDQVIRNVEAQPGVVGAGLVTNVPFSGHSGKSAATVKGRVSHPGESPRGSYSYAVAGNYFAAMGFVLHAGRFLASDERERNCVVDAEFARFYWPSGNALGQQLYSGSDATGQPYTVVGVVGPVKQAGLTDAIAQGAVYYPYRYRPEGELYLVARTATPPETLARTLQKVVRGLDPDLPLTDIRSMEARIDDSLLTRRSPAFLAGLFSAIALLLTTIGTYGVLSYAVAQRRREIAVRMALGAQPGQIRGQFLALAFRLLAAGLAFGLGGAWVSGQAMQAVLFQVPASHPLVLGGAAGVLALACLAACLLPSHRAARTSPREALSEG